MVTIRIESAAPPWSERDVAVEAAALLGRVEAMGLLDSLDTAITHLDTETMGMVFAQLRDRGLFPRLLDLSALASGETGVGARAAARVSDASTSRTLLHALRQANDALEDSAVPSDEWRHLRNVLGEDLLARLCGISLPSLRRYASGARTTPDAVASRLHTVALLVADLSGAYNDFGIRRWFLRPRTQLGGRAPGQLLTGPWSPDGPEIIEVRGLARAIMSSPAA
jgi:hypothetical protein